jgi:hypothetical protein
MVIMTAADQAACWRLHAPKAAREVWPLGAALNNRRRSTCSDLYKKGLGA